MYNLNHLSERNLTYFQHMHRAMRFGFLLILGGISSMIHSIIPFILTTHGSDTVRKIFHEIENERES